MNYFLRSLFFVLISGVFMNVAWCDDFSVKKVNHYAINLPSGYELLDITPGMADFELFEIVNKENRSDKMRLYFGNQPDFPSYDWAESPLKSMGEGVKKTFYDYRESDGALEGVLVFSSLSYRGSNQSPYSKIHYFAKAINCEAGARFLRVISSIKVVRPAL